ncbi:MAG: hypothetical protein CMJ46_01610 [Planctomyces sp.]|nr:hypothetical protein [Planctomyces sp.]
MPCLNSFSFRTFAVVAALTFLGTVPSSIAAQEESGNFFEGFNSPLRSATSGGGADQNGAVPEEPDSPQYEQLASDALASGEVHPSQQIETELTDNKAYEQFRRTNTSTLSDILKSGKGDPESMKVIDESLKQMLYSLTVKEHQQSDEVNEIFERIYYYFVYKIGENMTPTSAQQYREQVYSRMLPLIEELLKQNYRVRIQAATLLSDLDLKLGDARNNVAPIPYRAAVELAVKHVMSDEQAEAVKISLMRSLQKGLKYGGFAKNIRQKIAQVCIDELLKKADFWWYQRELIRTLTVCDVDTDETGKPFVVHALAVILSDPTRHYMVRSQAAHALGRVPMTAAMQINFELLSYELLNLSVEMAKERNSRIDAYASKNNQVPPQFLSHWGICFVNVYLAYNPLNAREKSDGIGLLQRTTRAGMNNNAAQVKQTYALTLPMVRFILTDGNLSNKFEDGWIQSGVDYLKDYPPGDLKVAPNTEPLVNLEPKSPDADRATATASIK